MCVREGTGKEGGRGGGERKKSGDDSDAERRE